MFSQVKSSGGRAGTLTLNQRPRRPRPIPSQDVVSGLVVFQVLDQNPSDISGLGQSELVGDDLEELLEFRDHPYGKISCQSLFHNVTRAFGWCFSGV